MPKNHIVAFLIVFEQLSGLFSYPASIIYAIYGVANREELSADWRRYAVIGAGLIACLLFTTIKPIGRYVK